MKITAREQSGKVPRRDPSYAACEVHFEDCLGFEEDSEAMAKILDKGGHDYLRRWIEKVPAAGGSSCRAL